LDEFETLAMSSAAFQQPRTVAANGSQQHGARRRFWIVENHLTMQRSAVDGSTVNDYPMISRLLTERRFRIRTMSPGKAPDPALDALALLVSFQFEAFRSFLRHMRGGMRENPGFHVKLEGMPGPQSVMLRNLCALFHANGLLDHYRMDHSSNRIVGSVAADERAFHFISGDWLENAVRVNVSQFLNLDGTPIELLENVEIMRPDGRNFELDVVLAIDGTMYWWEAKCGGYQRSDLERYREVAKELGLPRERAVLVLAEPEPDDTRQTVSRRTGMTVLAPDGIAAFIEQIEERHRNLVR
jgi:hypothetical protein